MKTGRKLKIKATRNSRVFILLFSIKYEKPVNKIKHKGSKIKRLILLSYNWNKSTHTPIYICVIKPANNLKLK